MELIDILDENGNKTGETLGIREIHAREKYHKSVHIWIISNNKILLQKRSEKMYSEKNKWDISSSGHVNSKEDSIKAAQRELKEELGLNIKNDKIIKIFSSKIEEKENFEFRDVYIVKQEIDISTCTVPNREVSELKWIDIEDYFKEIKNKNKDYVIKTDKYMNLLYKNLKAHI